MYKTLRNLYNWKHSSQLLKDVCQFDVLLQNKLWFNTGFQYVRCYLSPAFSCENKWNSRSVDPFVKNINPVDYYYDLTRKFKKDGKVSAIDVEIFVNCINENNVNDLHEELEEIVRLLRRSPETVNTLESTPHSIVRVLLDGKKYDLLLKMLSDPMNYGIFLNFYTTNLLMDTFLNEKNYMAAARVAANLMLQEDYGPPLSQSLVMLSCFKYIFNPDENEPWEDFNPVVEPEEEVKIVVKYIRNPYFDDHFDIKEPLHIVGKTLAWLSFHVNEPPLKRNAEVLGWALYEKWPELKQSMEHIINDKQQIDELVVNKVMERIEACPEEEKHKKTLLSLAQEIKNNFRSKPFIIEKIEQTVSDIGKNEEKQMIEQQEIVFDSWARERKEAVEKQLELFEKKRLLQEIEEKKEDIQNQEDVIFFFENFNKFQMLTPAKRKYYPKKLSLIYKKKKPKAIDEEYIPPEV